MRQSNLLVLMAFMAVILFMGSGCDDAAEEALEEATGFEWELNEDDFGVDTPENWYFLFAINLEEPEQAELIDQDFEVDVSVVEDLINLDDIEYQVVFAKKDLVNEENRLRFANKVKVEDKKIMLDSETNEKLGASVGSSGPGWYAVYFALEEFGFLNGEVADCNGALKAGILTVASDGPFFTHTADDGTWALPSLNGKPATVYFSDGEDCSGSSSDPVDEDPNPKDEETGEDTTPPNDEFGDGTDNIDAGEDEMQGDGSSPGNENMYDFEEGDEGFAGTGACWGVGGEGYGEFFPEGSESMYLWLSTGGSGFQSCTVTKTMTVPDGVSSLVVSYDYASQEPYEWINSAYNDIFTAIVQGEVAYVINRAINDTVPVPEPWIDVETAEAQTAGNINGSADATYNDTGAVFDAHLVGEGGDVPRGPDDNTAGKTAKFPVSAGATITLLITVSDVADAYWDSIGLIDWIGFE